MSRSRIVASVVIFFVGMFCWGMVICDMFNYFNFNLGIGLIATFVFGVSAGAVFTYDIIRLILD